MAFHEFGILPQPPQPMDLFEEYEPGKYGCIAVEDAAIDRLLPLAAGLACYWHGLGQPARGLNETGITLIPPQSLGGMLRAVQAAASAGFPTAQALWPLDQLLQKAREEGRFVIHFGL